MKWSGAAPCQCHLPPGADDLAEQTRKCERYVVSMEVIPASVIPTRTSRASDSTARSGSWVRAGWTGEHRGDVLEQLESAVECSACNHLEGDIGGTRRRCGRGRCFR